MLRLAGLLSASLALVLGVAACGGAGDDAGQETRALVYFLREGRIGPAARQVSDRETERAAVEALLAGPSAGEGTAGLTTGIPPGTRLADLEIAAGVATVDLTGALDDPAEADAMRASGLAQVVFTLTQFPTVTGVRVLDDRDPVAGGPAPGRPLRRADFEDLSPAILVERPAVGDVVRSPLRLQGTANTFEANFEYELLAADGRKLAGTFVTATCGTGCRGTFDEEVTFEETGASEVSLVAFERSAKDGSRTKEVRIPLTLAG